MSHIEPDQHVIAAMSEADPNEPVVMLNLLRFRERALAGFGVDEMSGQDAFWHYGTLNREAEVQYGSEPIWLGSAHRTVIGAEDWDLAILVSYPTRQHFIDKLADPTYQEIAKIRSAALEDSRLIELTQP
ncbi:MAG: hypothetical protein ACI9C1_000597 [Candidatus Aldehydirespiratoraceae bacterium]|jgi:uncharacterized protein (DUF1330 family)